MEDFVLTKNISDLYQHNADQIRNYAQLLKQRPELWMFVACDVDGKVLQVPQPVEGDDGNWNYQARFSQYHIAKQRCLFEGFEVVQVNSRIKDLKYNNLIVAYCEQSKRWVFDYAYKTLSDLTKYNLKLSQTAINK
jgi:hypothetical protein